MVYIHIHTHAHLWTHTNTLTQHTHTHTHTHARTHTHTTSVYTHYMHLHIQKIHNIIHCRASAGGSTTQNINQARPSDTTEEDIQLQLALQMSKEHQEELDRLRWALSRDK